jgi:NAD(P)-dependent dehydrogenase (short-subunit alcohol dehydrogenase family)
VVVDLESADEIGSAARRILADTDGVDVLVHSAGSIAFGSFEELSADDLDRQLRVNLRAPVLLTQRLLPAVRRVRGQIVFVNSLAAHRPSAHNAFYAATKRGLTAVADGLRDEVNDEGVRVVSVYTGRTATPMQVAMHRREGRPYAPELLLQPEDVVDVILSAISVAASGEVTDVSLRPARKLPAT